MKGRGGQYAGFGDAMGRAKRASVISVAVAGVVALFPTLVSSQTQTSATLYEYDAVGNRTKVTDPRSAVTNQAYDALNRMTLQQLPAASAGGTPQACRCF